MKNVATYLPPPAAQRKVQPAEFALIQRVGVNTELGKIWTVVADKPPAIRACWDPEPGIWSVTFESCRFVSRSTNWNGNSRICPEWWLWVELCRCSVMWMRVSGAAAYCPHGWLGSAKPDGALSSISMSPAQIATFIHSFHTITPKRLKASRPINRGKFVFQWHCSWTNHQRGWKHQKRGYTVGFF